VPLASLLLVVDFDYGHLAHADLGGSRCWRVVLLV
jgi:hypothetical protein